jgi:drug/metabolite transporter (DMT)-like permease
MALVAVLLVSQGAGLTLVLLVVLVRGEGPPDAGALALGAAAGATGLFGLACFYRGLAVGTMTVVAPISSTAAVIPVVVGIATGERPSFVQGAGIALALAGVALASREEADESETSGRMATGVGLALGSALGFGTFFVLLDLAAEHDVPWAMLASRGTSVALIAAIALTLRPSLSGVPAVAGLLVLIGVLDVGANGMFALASTLGLVSLVAVLSSLYPIVTVAAARFVLHERVARLQAAGVALALLGVVLISAG